MPILRLFRLVALIGLALATLAAPAAARKVEVGAFVTALSDIDAPGGSFGVGFFIWFNDPEGRFDLEQDLFIYAHSVKISDVEVETRHDGSSYTYARIEAVGPQEFDLASFPFDRQRLVLRMEAQDSTDIEFVADRDGSGVSDYLTLRGWTIDGVSVLTEDHAYRTDFGYWRPGDSTYSQIAVAVDVTRTRSPVLLDDFLGFTFAFLITSLTFFVPCSELGLRIGMTTGSLFAAVVNLNRLHDAVGFRPDFALVDRLAFLVFGALFGSLAIAITTNRMAKHGAPERANRIDSLLGASMMSLVLILVLLTVQTSL